MRRQALAARSQLVGGRSRRGGDDDTEPGRSLADRDFDVARDERAVVHLWNIVTKARVSGQMTFHVPAKPRLGQAFHWPENDLDGIVSDFDLRNVARMEERADVTFIHREAGAGLPLGFSESARGLAVCGRRTAMGLGEPLVRANAFVDAPTRRRMFIVHADRVLWLSAFVFGEVFVPSGGLVVLARGLFVGRDGRVMRADPATDEQREPYARAEDAQSG